MWDLAFHGLLAGSALLIGYLISRESLRDWKAAAELCGLEGVEISSWTRKIKARSGPVDVRIGYSGDRDRPTRVVAVGSGPPGLRDVSIRLPTPLFRPEIEVGDPGFDLHFVVEGPEPLVSALLDRDTRLLFSRLHLDCEVQLVSGELRADMADERIFDVLPRLVEAAGRFAQPLEIPRRLAANARQDAVSGVRLHNLGLLIRELPDDPLTAAVLREACSDPSPKVRLRAARELGAEGRGVLLELAEALDDDGVSAQAVSALGRELSSERAKALFLRARIQRRPRTARACLGALGLWGEAAVDALAEVLAGEDVELAVAAAEALGATGSPAAEPPLLEALQREPPELRVAAMNALGSVGSASAVLPLKEAAEGSWLGLSLRQAARQAVAEIQSRIDGASPGQLSLAGTEAGQLSLADDSAGMLSLGGDEET